MSSDRQPAALRGLLLNFTALCNPRLKSWPPVCHESAWPPLQRASEAKKGATFQDLRPHHPSSTEHPKAATMSAADRLLAVLSATSEPEMLKALDERRRNGAALVGAGALLFSSLVFNFSNQQYPVAGYEISADLVPSFYPEL